MLLTPSPQVAVIHLLLARYIIVVPIGFYFRIAARSIASSRCSLAYHVFGDGFKVGRPACVSCMQRSRMGAQVETKGLKVIVSN